MGIFFLQIFIAKKTFHHFEVVRCEYTHTFIIINIKILPFRGKKLILTVLKFSILYFVFRIASIKDGYAVKVSTSPMESLQVLDTSTAGDNPEKCSVRDGYCVRISTGIVGNIYF